MAKLFRKIQGNRASDYIKKRSDGNAFKIINNEFFGVQGGVNGTAVVSISTLIFTAFAVVATDNASASISTLNANYTAPTVTAKGVAIVHVAVSTANYIDYVVSAKGSANSTIGVSNLNYNAPCANAIGSAVANIDVATAVYTDYIVDVKGNATTIVETADANYTSFIIEAKGSAISNVDVANLEHFAPIVVAEGSLQVDAEAVVSVSVLNYGLKTPIVIVIPPSGNQGGSSESYSYVDNSNKDLDKKIIQEDSEIMEIVKLCLKITII